MFLGGDCFRFFMVAYLAFRLAIDAIKPVPYAYFGIFSGIQLLSIGGLCYYWRDLPRLGRVVWARS